MKVTVNAGKVNQIVNADEAVVYGPRTAPGRAPATHGAQLKVFLSYRRDDSRYLAERIYDRLIAWAGKGSVFKDVDSIPLGADFRLVLERALMEADAFLAVIGPNWINAQDEHGRRRLDAEDDYVRLEIETALKRRLPMIPLLMEGARMPLRGELPSSLEDFAFQQGTVVRTDPDFHRDVDRLIELLGQRRMPVTKTTGETFGQ